MRVLRQFRSRLVFTALVVLTAACAEPRPSYKFEPTACAPEVDALHAECGTVAVPENYGAPAARKISLGVVILRSATAASRHAPLFELEGGPGVAVSANVSFYATDGAIYHQNRDIVFVDLRGTGGSNPLRCEALEAYDQSTPPGPMYPTKLTAECATRLSEHADLSQYTTANAVKDLEAVRTALGADQIALDALSYGTTLALAYIAEHPERVSAAVLTSAVPADRTPPRFHATAADAALAQLFAACDAEPTCAKRFPDPASDLERARRRFSTTEAAEIFAERLRVMMYAPATARRVPLFLEQSARGETHAAHGAGPAIADGSYLSITCAESFPHFDVEAARTEARRTVFGDYRLRRQQAACSVWPVKASVVPQPNGPIAVPVLFVSGSLDPVSPPTWVEPMLPLFPQGRLLMVEGGGHVVDGLSNLDTCYDPLIVRFLDTRDAGSLDVSCLENVRPPPFALE